MHRHRSSHRFKNPASNILQSGLPNFGIAQANQSTTSIVRSQGFKVTWTGGDVNSYVDIACQVPGSPNGGGFDRHVPAAADSFTIPAAILLAMSAFTGQLYFTPNANWQTISVPDADLGGAVVSGTAAVATVVFK